MAQQNPEEVKSPARLIYEAAIAFANDPKSRNALYLADRDSNRVIKRAPEPESRQRQSLRESQRPASHKITALIKRTPPEFVVAAAATCGVASAYFIDVPVAFGWTAGGITAGALCVRSINDRYKHISLLPIFSSMGAIASVLLGAVIMRDLDKSEQILAAAARDIAQSCPRKGESNTYPFPDGEKGTWKILDLNPRQSTLQTLDREFKPIGTTNTIVYGNYSISISGRVGNSYWTGKYNTTRKISPLNIPCRSSSLRSGPGL